MTKKNTKQNKTLLQEERSNVFKDKKRRIFYIDPLHDKAYRLNPGDEGFAYIYDSKSLFAMLPIALGFSFLNLSVFWVTIIGIVIYLAIQIYYMIKLKGLTEVQTIPEDVLTRTHDVTVLKSRRTDLMLKVTMAFLVIIIVITSLIENKTDLSVINMDSAGIYLSVVFTTYVLFELLRIYFKNATKLRAVK